jgi:hypothetical protein
MTLSVSGQEEEDTAFPTYVTIAIGNYSIGVESEVITGLKPRT